MVTFYYIRNDKFKDRCELRHVEPAVDFVMSTYRNEDLILMPTSRNYFEFFVISQTDTGKQRITTSTLFYSDLTPIAKIQFWPDFVRDRRFLLPANFEYHHDSTIIIGKYATHMSKIYSLMYCYLAGHSSEDPDTGRIRWKVEHNNVVLRLGKYFF